MFLDLVHKRVVSGKKKKDYIFVYSKNVLHTQILSVMGCLVSDNGALFCSCQANTFQKFKAANHI